MGNETDSLFSVCCNIAFDITRLHNLNTAKIKNSDPMVFFPYNNMLYGLALDVEYQVPYLICYLDEPEDFSKETKNLTRLNTFTISDIDYALWSERIKNTISLVHSKWTEEKKRALIPRQFMSYLTTYLPLMTETVLKQEYDENKFCLSFNYNNLSYKLTVNHEFQLLLTGDFSDEIKSFPQHTLEQAVQYFVNYFINNEENLRKEVLDKKSNKEKVKLFLDTFTNASWHQQELKFLVDENLKLKFNLPIKLGDDVHEKVRLLQEIHELCKKLSE